MGRPDKQNPPPPAPLHAISWNPASKVMTGHYSVAAGCQNFRSISPAIDPKDDLITDHRGYDLIASAG